MVVSRKVGGEDLGEITPLGKEDDEKGRRNCSLSVGTGLLLDEGLFTGLAAQFVARVADSEGGAGEEHRGNDDLDGPVRKDVEERDADRGGDGDMDDKGGRGTEPDSSGPSSSGHDERGEHRLVRQLADEDDREHGGGDDEVHPDRSRALTGTEESFEVLLTLVGTVPCPSAVTTGGSERQPCGS
jgi:hypothetical protein